MSATVKVRIKKGCLFLGILLSFSVTPTFAQTQPDCLVITRYRFFDKAYDSSVEGDSLTGAIKTTFLLAGGNYVSNDTIVDNSVVNDLLSEINNPDNLDTSLKRFGIDTDWIKQNPDKLLAYSTYAKHFAWNKPQKELILKALVNIDAYQKNFYRSFQNGCCYGIDNYVRFQYTVDFYRKGRVVKTVSSRRYTRGSRVPWTDEQGRKIYSYKMDDIVDLMLNNHRKILEVLNGQKLLAYLVNGIVEQNAEKLHRLAPYTYQKEIDELKPVFNVKSYTEMTGYGGYHGDGPLIAVILNNQEMLPNLQIQFLASKIGNTIFSRDSIIKNYKYLVNRVKSVKFLNDYLKANPDQYLDILYFNDKPINQYNIEAVNKGPKGWKEHDAYVKSLDWYKENNYKPSFDLAEAIKTSERNDCGCNYRFTNDFIGSAITFVINDKDHKDFSWWFLLPDNTVLLYLMQGNQAMGHLYTEFGEYPGMQYPCVRFDADGNIVPKR